MRNGAAGTFVAIDFETANEDRASACALGLVRVESDALVARETHLIRPAGRRFVFTGIHGISWSDVGAAPTFGEIWPAVERFIVGARFLAAHNASFDRSVWRACCAAFGVAAPAIPFLCTVRLSRQAFGIYPTKLPDVCRSLRIELRHHDAAADAEAAARIVLAARATHPEVTATFEATAGGLTARRLTT